MRVALSTLLQLQSEGLLQRFAIGGAIAASFYIEAVATEDLDVFAFIAPQPSGFVLLTPLYERIKSLGGRVHNEHIVIGGWPVQILPAFNPHVEAAVLKAPAQSYENLLIPVISADYLAAIALLLGRAKDYLRVDALIAAGACQLDALNTLIATHQLQDRWESYVRRLA
jgi:hypothetical protein